MSSSQSGRAQRSTRATGIAAAVAASVIPLAPTATADETAIVLGGSGLSEPPPLYVDAVNDLFLNCFAPDCTLDPTYAPMGLYPVIGGPKGITAEASVLQGTKILDNELEKAFSTSDNVTVLGYSQGAQVATIEMQKLLDGTASVQPNADQLSFILLGNPNNPNGGILERLDLPYDDDAHLTIPSFGLIFNGATPVTEYPTDIYTIEYDPIADFPKYPLNLLSDLNAAMGFLFVHTQYPNPDAIDLSQAVLVPTSEGYDGATNYWMLPSENLPLLAPLQSVPVVGKLLTELIEPNMRVLVNLGYGDPEYGWVNENADLPTGIGLFPSAENLAKVPQMLIEGTQQGIQNAWNLLQNPDELFSLEGNPLVDLLNTPYFADSSLLTSIATFGEPGLDPLTLLNAVSSAATNIYGTLLPTADFINALTTTLPGAAATIFANELAEGDVLGALLMPAAESIGLLTNLSILAIPGIAEGYLFAGLDLISPFVDVNSFFA